MKSQPPKDLKVSNFTVKYKRHSENYKCNEKKNSTLSSKSSERYWIIHAKYCVALNFKLHRRMNIKFTKSFFETFFGNFTIYLQIGDLRVGLPLVNPLMAGFVNKGTPRTHAGGERESIKYTYRYLLVIITIVVFKSFVVVFVQVDERPWTTSEIL